MKFILLGEGGNHGSSSRRFLLFSGLVYRTGLPILRRLWCLRERRGGGRPLRPAVSPKETIKHFFGWVSLPSLLTLHRYPKKGNIKLSSSRCSEQRKQKRFLGFFIAKMVVTERALKICTDYTSYIIIKLNFCLIKISLPYSPWTITTRTRTTTSTVPWSGLRRRQTTRILGYVCMISKRPSKFIYLFFSSR